MRAMKPTASSQTTAGNGNSESYYEGAFVFDIEGRQTNPTATENSDQPAATRVDQDGITTIDLRDYLSGGFEGRSGGFDGGRREDFRGGPGNFLKIFLYLFLFQCNIF